MTTPFEAKKNIRDASSLIREFMADHQKLIWQVFKPLAPYIIGFAVLDMFLDIFVFTTNAKGENIATPIGQFFSIYFWSCFVITWHRIVLHGADNYVPVNPMKPKNSELAFMGMGIVLFLGAVATGGIIGGILGAIANAVLFGLGLLCIVFATIYCMMRFSFFFPAKATGNYITFAQAFKMSKGCIWKMYATSIKAPIKIILLTMLYAAVGTIIVEVLLSILGGSQIAIGVLTFVYNLPILLFFNPILTAFGVTVLSNYYQYALQNNTQETEPYDHAS